MIKAGMDAWGDRVMQHQHATVDYGSPLGKTKEADRNEIIENRGTAFIIVKANSHDEAARFFIKHPQFMIFPGDSIEMPLPGAPN